MRTYKLCFAIACTFCINTAITAVRHNEIIVVVDYIVIHTPVGLINMITGLFQPIATICYMGDIAD